MSAAPPDAPGPEPAPAEPTVGPVPADPVRRGMSALAGEEFSFAEAIGGVRGLVESVLPGVVFVVTFLAARPHTDAALTMALVGSVGVALVATVARLAQRTPVTQALSGLLGVGIGVFWAWRTGEAQDFFAWGLWVNVAWFVGALVSILARWPFVGVVVALLRDEGFGWRTEKSAAAARLRRRYAWASWAWVAMFGARLAVQVPLYLQGEDAVGWLGTAKLVMGLPLTAVTLWVSWLLVRRREAPAAPSGPSPAP